MRALLILALAASAQAGGPDAGGRKAYDAYRDGDYRAALALAWPACQKDDPVALLTLGRMFLDGAGAPKDAAKADVFFQKALAVARRDAAKNARAQWVLARMLDGGWAAPRDFNAALTAYRASAGRGEVMAMESLGSLYFEGHDVKKDPAASIQWHQRAVDAGSMSSLNDLGATYLYGLGVPRDAAKARSYLEKGARLGSRHARANLDVLEAQADPAKAFALVKRAAEKGNAAAQTRLGFDYMTGQGVPPSDEEAAKWFRAAAEQGDGRAEQMLGVWSLTGRGGPKDVPAAARWFERADSHGVKEAPRALGTIYLGLYPGVGADYAKAGKWLTKGAALGDAQAMGLLGSMVGNGQGTRKDLGKAAKIFERAASAGDAFSADSLGSMYLSGSGVPKDEAAAAKWFKTAAERGYPHGAYDYATMLDSGRGVPKDEKAAQAWYETAAEHGNLDARRRLNDMLIAGASKPEPEAGLKTESMADMLTGAMKMDDAPAPEPLEAPTAP